jgi:hypothetical protein
MARYALIHNNKIRQIIEQQDQPTIPGDWQLLTDGREDVGDAWPWVAPPPKPAGPRIVQAQDFWDLFTKAERILLDIAEQHNPADTLAKQKASAERRLRHRDIDRDGHINMDKNWVSQYLTDMETDGILAAGRANAILTAPQ